MRKKRPTTDPRCGSNAGYYRHYHAGEQTCRDCRSAHYAHYADANAARQQACQRLAREHAERFRELYTEELERRGITQAGEKGEGG